MKIIVVPLLVLLSSTAFAQENRPSRVRRVPTPPIPTRPATSPAKPSTSGKTDLSTNITLAFKGTLPGSGETDIELTGCGPKFLAELVTAPDNDPDMPDPIVTISATVIEDGELFRVDYSLGSRIATVTSTMQGPDKKVSRNIAFRDMMIHGTVIAKPGKPVVISKVNDKSLTLTLSFPEQP